MIKVISEEKRPIKMWLSDIEDGALEQAKNMANLPFTFKHVAIMPDAHTGYGGPIGGILAAKGVIVPNFVGLDIGCGMCAIRTSLQEITKPNLIKIRNRISELIPVGFSHHKDKQNEDLIPRLPSESKIVKQQYESALYQIGTLGGGNHFIEIQKGDQGYIWIMIHSGSRNVGYKVAKYYNAAAIKMNERWFSKVDKSLQLAFLPIETQMAKSYMEEMNFCVDFAFANRQLMMERVKQAFFENVGGVDYDSFINIAHNYARWENHYNTNVIVHRKGATSARSRELGIIPGSQGTKSYIVEGKGNEQSFKSCSHGAGRKMGRKQAINNLSLSEERERLDKLGVIHNLESEQDLDEAAGAYKDIDEVMSNQHDLVKILVMLKPLAVIKG